MQSSFGSCDLEDGDRATALPTFDLDAYVRESESGVHAIPERETQPPPALHPASLPPMPPPPALPQRISSSLQARLGDCARRSELLTTTLRVGVVSREEAARILRIELAALEVAARGSRNESLRVMALRLRDVIEELGGIAGEDLPVGRDVVVLDANPETAALMAISLESHGHVVRVASSLPELAAARAESPIEALFVAIDFPGADPNQAFCTMLREIAGAEAMPVVVYGRVSELRLASLAERAKADASLRIDMGMADLFPAVGSVLGRLAF